MLVVLFGLPGAGKSYAGTLLRDQFGFHLYEADEDLPAEYVALAAAGRVAPEAMRDAYHRRVVERLERLSAANSRLAVAVPLLRDRHRQWIRQRFPDAIFVLVECNTQRRESRLDARVHAVTTSYARQVMALLEPPNLPHVRLDNSAYGPGSVRRQLDAILAAAARAEKLSAGDGE
jgi:gluconate kinase